MDQRRVNVSERMGIDQKIGGSTRVIAIIKTESSIESEDIIIEILIRLPKRPLARFKSVSKQWRKIISSPSFIRNYAARNISVFGFLNNGKLDFVRVDSENPSCLVSGTSSRVFTPEKSKIHILESCNGLMLCAATTEEENKREWNRNRMYEYFFILYNPIIDQYFPLPPPPKYTLSLRHPMLRYPSDYFTGCNGLAFDDSRNPPQLVVVRVLNGHRAKDRTRRSVVKVHSFSSYTFGWRCLDHDLSSLFSNSYTNIDVSAYTLVGHSTFLNGKLHWLSGDEKYENVYAYDVDRERFSLIQIHVKRTSVIGSSSLGQSRDRLVYFNLTEEFSIWTLQDYNRGYWSLDYRFPLQVPMQPIAFNPVDTRILYFTFYYGSQIVSINLETGDLRQLYHPHINLYDVGTVFFPYELPRSPPSLPPHCYFSALFGEFPSMGWNGIKDILQSPEVFRARCRQFAIVISQRYQNLYAGTILGSVANRNYHQTYMEAAVHPVGHSIVQWVPSLSQINYYQGVGCHSQFGYYVDPVMDGPRYLNAQNRTNQACASTSGANVQGPVANHCHHQARMDATVQPAWHPAVQWVPSLSQVNYYEGVGCHSDFGYYINIVMNGLRFLDAQNQAYASISGMYN